MVLAGVLALKDLALKLSQSLEVFGRVISLVRGRQVSLDAFDECFAPDTLVRPWSQSLVFPETTRNCQQTE